MHITERALHRRRFTIIVLAVLIANGMLGFLNMPRLEDPLIEMKEASVVVTYPGAAPEEIEDFILDPLEEHLMGLEDVEHVDSWAMDGASYSVVYYFDDADIDNAVDATIGALTEAEMEFPPGVLRTEVVRHRTDRVVAIQIAVSGDDYTYDQLENYAEEIKDELRRISEVRKTEIEGAQEREIRVSIDIDRLAAYGISPLDVADRIAAANVAIPAGKIELSRRKFNVNIGGDFDSIDDVRQTVIDVRGGIPIRLSDIAAVNMAHKDSTYWVRHNGRRAVFVTATQKEATNLIDLGNKARRVVREVSARFPQDVQVEIVFDQPDYVSKRLTSFANNLLYGGILVAIVVFILVGGRLAVVILLAIPLSIIIGIGGIYRYGLSFEQISISALILALGMLVDNAIVISENIQRRLDMGLDRFQAALKGTIEVSAAVTSATATTIAAFIPMMAMPGSSGMFIRSMPLTVAFTLASSLLVALIATPLISLLILRPSVGGGEHFFARGLRRIGDNYYPIVLKAALKKPALVIFATLLALAGSIGLFNSLGKEFFPKADKTTFPIEVRRPEGANLASVDSILRVIEAELIAEPGVAHTLANVGKGNPVVYYNMGRSREKDNYGQILVVMKSGLPQEETFALVDKYRRRWSDSPLARIEVKEFAQGPPIGAPIAIRVEGEDLKILTELTGQVEAILRDTPGAINIDNELTSGGGEIRVEVDRHRAGMLGVPQAYIARTLRMALSGETVTKFRLGDEDIEVVMRLPFSEPPKWETFSRIFIPNAAGTMIPLNELADPVISGTAPTIVHRDRKRNFTVRADIADGYFAAGITAELKPKLEAVNWPDGYSCIIEGETKERDESFSALFSAAVIAILVIYAILVLQFHSFIQPLVIFSALPMAFIGAILGLWVTGNNFGFLAFVGVESLIGIVINDAIVMLDFINKRLQMGYSRDEALLEAGKIRFVPILLTSITTIGGLMPLTILSGKMWAPMGWTIVGGLLFSTILTLIIVPVLFKLMVRVK
ncbi:MAG: efflux RND transporter permease subunit [candidate division Zixibacteria bacterium]|nr:efflux RND transporter permease subunit [Candidatus Tariuqbacter arcticus]